MDQPIVQNTEKPNLEAYQALLEIDESERTFKRRQGYNAAYAMSLLIPPVGVFFFFKYLFFETGSRDDIKAGCISLGLTITSLLLSLWLMGVFFSQATSALPNQGGDALKEFITPGNANKMINVLK